MTPADFQARCAAIGLKTNTAIAAALKRDRRTIYDWLHGIRPIPHWADAQIDALERAFRERQS